MKKIITIGVLALCALATTAGIVKTTLIRAGEISLNPNYVIQLPGVGLVFMCSPDSAILLDAPDLAAIHWLEPNDARDMVLCGEYMYAASSDSIYRVATDDSPRKFVARMDNEQFRIYPANDSTFYVCTADEEFSNLMVINPGDGELFPLLAYNGPIQKVAELGGRTMLWTDDMITMYNADADSLEYIFHSSLITDMALCQMGVIVATTECTYLIENSTTGGRIIPEGVQRIWWDNDDILYYLTLDGDFKAITGIREAWLERKHKSRTAP